MVQGKNVKRKLTVERNKNNKEHALVKSIKRKINKERKKESYVKQEKRMKKKHKKSLGELSYKKES